MSYRQSCQQCRCKNCDKSLDGVNYLEDQDEPVCAECFEELYAVKCHRCSKPLNMGDPDTKTKYIVCDNKNYHTSCYTCKVSLIAFNFTL